MKGGGRKKCLLLLCIFEVGFERVAKALGVLDKLFLLLFQSLPNRNTDTFNQCYGLHRCCMYLGARTSESQKNEETKVFAFVCVLTRLF